jgi:DNA repair exonuclease SbcCD ATPase subunit
VRRLILASLPLLLLPACHRNKPADVAPITAEDESLRKNESELITQRGALQRERKKIADARAEIVERRSQLGHDSAGQAALDEEEKKLLAKESDLSSQESQVNAKLDELLRMRGDLVKKATQVVATAPGADPLERAARREQSVASRERDVAEREHDVAQREAQLAAREAVLAKRERDTCGAVAMPAKIDLPKGLHYTAKDVEPTYKKALKLMQDKGLLASDLPPGTGKLVEDTREAMKKADFVRAKYDAEQLLATVEEIKIDRSFISAKMARLSAAMRGKKLDGGDKKTVEDLFQEATANYGDGKFPQANTKINRLFALLKAG